MPTFEYTALGTDGRKEAGIVTADNARAARKELRFRSLTPLSIMEAGDDQPRAGRFGSRKLKLSEQVLATRQLAILIASGVQVEQALGTISSQSETPTTRRIFASLRDKVSEGYKFSESLGDFSNSFSGLYVSATAAGEVSGDLSVVMDNLADHLEQTQRTRRKVQTALIYPTVLGVVALLVIALLMAFVVPRVVEQFDNFGQDLPVLTQIVIGISNIMRSYGWLMAVGFVLAVIGWRRALRVPSVRRRIDRFMLRLPIAGKLIRTTQSARFARTFAMLVGSGTPVLESMSAARDGMSNVVFTEAIDDAIIALRDGGAPARALSATGVFPPMLTSLIASSTGSDSLAGLMNKGAGYLEDEFDRTSSIFLGLLEPAIILILGTIVALIVLSIMLPLLQLNTLAFS